MEDRGQVWLAAAIFLPAFISSQVCPAKHSWWGRCGVSACPVMVGAKPEGCCAQRWGAAGLVAGVHRIGIAAIWGAGPGIVAAGG
ncbi:hypothetical protein [Acetobacter papayae]|uniref:hypothetical protein n=1 Tax=Acetobacter papayae TaxID=1076592 RepID=UPI0011DD3D70|nr:hypothetical protein [Acetobacter papayae]